MSYSSLANIVWAVGRTGANGVSLLGTATLLNSPGKFVTAAHVTNKDEQNLVVVVKPDYSSINDYQDTSDERVQVLPVRIEAIDPFTDLCILSADIDAFSNISMGNTDLLTFGSLVDIFGYPHAVHGRFVFTHQRTEIGAKILIKNGIVKTKQVVLNTQARPGQSGSPIFCAYTTFMVAILIGSYAPGGGGGLLVAGVDPHTLHQTTHAVSVEYVREML